MNVANHAVFAAQVGQRFLSAHGVTVVSSLAPARQALAAENYEVAGEKESREKRTNLEIGRMLTELELNELL